MATLTIPVRLGVEAFNQTVELDGKYYRLSFYYNLRDQHWYLTIARETVDLVSGIKLVNTNDLLYQFRHIEDIPQGVLFITDTKGLYRDPDAVDFGSTILLKYTDAI